MRKKTTRREAMTVGLGAVVLGAAGEVAAAEETSSAKKIGRHLHNGVPEVFHIIGTFNPDAKDTSVTVAGKIGNLDVKWLPDPNATILSIDATRIRAVSTPTWNATKVDKDNKDGIGSLTVIVTNDGNPTTLKETDVSYA